MLLLCGMTGPRSTLGRALREATARGLWTAGLWQLLKYPLVPNHSEGRFIHMVSGSNSLMMKLPNYLVIEFSRDLSFSIIWSFIVLSAIDVLGAKLRLSTNETRLCILGPFTARLVIDPLEARMH